MFRFDLHIHSCLSPCADLDSSPSAIVARAREVGLDGLMLADHNSARNAPALAEVCRRTGFACLFGMEICTSEEAHVLAVFDTLAQSATMMEACYAALPKRVNVPDVFGDQVVVDADEGVEELEWRMLSAPTTLSIRQAGALVHDLGGLFIAAHIDRPVFSVTSQLGGVTADAGFDAVEISRHADLEGWRARALGLPILRASDAHYLDDIGVAWSEAQLREFSVAELKRVFSAGLLGVGKK